MCEWKEGKEGEGKEGKVGKSKEGKVGKSKEGKEGKGKEGKEGEWKEGKVENGKEGKEGKEWWTVRERKGRRDVNNGMFRERDGSEREGWMKEKDG